MTRFVVRQRHAARMAIASAAIAAVALAQAAPVAGTAGSDPHAAPATTAVPRLVSRPPTCGVPLTVCIRIPA